MRGVRAAVWGVFAGEDFGVAQLFLTIAELKELSGAKHKGKVCRWLTENRYPYDVGADGWPRVLRTYLERRLAGAVPLPTTRPKLELA